ncbi:hypothetical protein Tco_0143310 [Tanacetum coccineum]
MEAQRLFRRNVPITTLLSGFCPVVVVTVVVVIVVAVVVVIVIAVIVVIVIAVVVVVICSCRPAPTVFGQVAKFLAVSACWSTRTVMVEVTLGT